MSILLKYWSNSNKLIHFVDNLKYFFANILEIKYIKCDNVFYASITSNIFIKFINSNIKW